MTGPLTGPFSSAVGRDDIVARIGEHPLGDDVAAQRRRFELLVLGDPLDETIESMETADTNPQADAVRFPGEGGTIVYLHGGGYAFGSPRTHERIGRGLAERTGLTVVLPDYPLAPEHRWPAQLDAAMAALQGFVGPIVLAGDSAGGHLALVTALESARRDRRDDRDGQVAGLILFSPNTDRTGLSTTRTSNDSLDPMVDDAGDRQLAQQCFGGIPFDDAQVSPVLDDLTLLPPIHVEVGSDEVLLGDSLVLARRAQEAGCAVTLHVDPDGLHMGQLWAPWWAPARSSLDRAAAFARDVVTRRTAPTPDR